MRRIVLALAVVVALAIGMALPTSALGLTEVTVNCDDGTGWTAVVDTGTLASVAASVQGMLDYPAGVTCTLVQTPLAQSFDGAVLA
jgi:hypothetical protein